MPRQNRRRRDEPPERPARGLLGSARRETDGGGDWLVRSVPGGASDKTYRCPGCDQEVRPGVPHVVAWPEHSSGTERRRHWHTSCWAARGRRRPGPQRGGRGPRY